MPVKHAVHLVVVFAVTFSAVTFLTIITALATNHWQTITYSKQKVLELNASGNIVDSPLDSQNFFKVLTYRGDMLVDDCNATCVNDTYYLYNEYGGIWRLCDSLTDGERELVHAGTKEECIEYLTYIPALDKDTLTGPGIDILRMLNSACSVFILILIVLTASMVTGAVGLIFKEVIACMVTAVLYFISAFYIAFGLSVVHNKIAFENNCNTFPLTLPYDFCTAREVTTSWSMVIAWISFPMSFITFCLWCYLTRLMRIEKTQIT